MKSNIIAAATLSALSLASASASATATASATLNNITVSISALKASGPAPTATLTAFYGANNAQAYEVTDTPFTLQNNIVYSNNAFDNVSASTAPADAGAASSFTGDAFADPGATISTSAFANGNAGASAYGLGQIDFGSGGYVTFTLGANTVLDISATYSFATLVTATGPSAYEYADAVAYLNLTGTNGHTTNTSISQASVSSQQYFGASVTPVALETGELDVSIVSGRTTGISGTFFGYVYADAYSNTAAVPEPANIALMLAGLGAIGLVARRRRSN